MTIAATAFAGVTTCGVRVVAGGGYRRFMGGVAIGLVAMAGAGVLATMAAAWLVSGALSSNLNAQARATFGPRTVALTRYRQPPVRAADRTGPVRIASNPVDARDISFETRWARAVISAPDRAPPLAPPLKPKIAKVREIKVAALTAVAAPIAAPPKPTARLATSVPLPRARPASHPIARAPAAAPATRVASVTPAPETTGSIPRDPVEHVHNKVTLPTPGSRTAVYDIAAHTVYLPNGERLEAHSGLGDKMDNPRYVHLRMRGATPPNVYNLTMRERLFHGVQAIRLNPVDDDKMFGRDGILAHTYMLGSNGQSNGCVSFKNYAAFLRAFQRGEVERLVVVANLGDTVPDLERAPVRTARATPVRRWRVADSRPAVVRQRPLTGQW